MNQNSVDKQDAQVRKVATQNLKTVFSQTLLNPTAFVNTILDESVSLLASDILFEPDKADFRVRARIDGILYELGRAGLEAYPKIASRIKILSKLDPTEKKKDSRRSVYHRT